MAISFVHIFFLLLLLLSPLHLSLAKKCIFTEKYEVHIINKLPPNSPQLKVHCASKDNDFGMHYPITNEDFNWSFCGLLFSETTLYFCHFWWNSKDKAFDVFNDKDYCVHNQTFPNHLKYCKWEVRSDGFYLEQYNSDTKQYFMSHYMGWS